MSLVSGQQSLSVNESKLRTLSGSRHLFAAGEGSIDNIFTKISKRKEKYEFRKKPVAHPYSNIETSATKIDDYDKQSHIYFSFKKSRRDDTLETILFKNDTLEVNLITLLSECLDSYPLLTVVKFEFCGLTAKHIEELEELLEAVKTVKEVSVNGNPIPNQNFFLLLKHEICCLSLKYCNINVEGMKKICTELYKPFENPLLHLNLASNSLYDEGVYYAAKLLRMNRKLLSLNLSDNKITDAGAITLMEPLNKFELGEEEMVERRRIKFEHQKKMIDLYFVNKSKEALVTVSSTKKKKSIGSRSKFSERRSTRMTGTVTTSSTKIGDLPFIELPYHPTLQESIEEDTSTFCIGNNILTNLNLSCNISTNKMELHKVFVYGTLKNGEPNHSWFSKSTDGYYKYIGKAKTTEKLPLIIATKYNVPFVLNSPGNGTFIIGEVYEVDDKVLADLDVLEDHPNFYVREKFNATLLNTENSTENVWIYVIRNFNPKLLNETFYESYSTLGPHGRRYVERYLRDEPLGCKHILL